ncbi:hypothetical protein B296_00039750, partial [Ensete ventricosum]
RRHRRFGTCLLAVAFDDKEESQASPGWWMVWMPSDVVCCMGLPRSLSQSAGSPLIPDAGATAAAGSFPSADVDRVSPRGHRRHNSCSYFRLPTDPLLRLSVLKLDGSSFGTNSILMCKSRRPHPWGSLRKPSRNSSVSLPKTGVASYPGGGLFDSFVLLDIFLSTTGQAKVVRKIMGLIQYNIEMKDKNRDHEGVASSQFVDEQNDDDDDDDDDNQIGRIDFKLRRLFHGLFPYAKLGTSQDDEYSKVS